MTRCGLVFFLAVLAAIIFSRHAFSAETDARPKEIPVSLDLLVKEVDDLSMEEAQILEDQKEILKTIQNLKIRVNKK